MAREYKLELTDEEFIWLQVRLRVQADNFARNKHINVERDKVICRNLLKKMEKLEFPGCFND